MSSEPTQLNQNTRPYPTLTKTDDGEYHADVPEGFSIKSLMGMKTHEAAHGAYISAVSAIGKSVDKYSSFVSAMFAELEPRDGVEAMLIGQMTATHVAMTTFIERMSYQESYQVRESYERSMTRLSRTYLAQMEALKKHRAKAQQIVRVERVNVESGGQAIVGDVSTRGRAEHEK